MGKIHEHRELSLEDVNRKIFLLKIQAVLYPGEVLGEFLLPISLPLQGMSSSHWASEFLQGT